MLNRFTPSVVVLALLAGCATKAAPYNPQQDNLISYAKSIISDNEYRKNVNALFIDRLHDGMRHFEFSTSSKMGGKPFYLAMMDACRVEGGVPEEVTEYPFNQPSAGSKQYSHYAFVCRHANKGATLVRVANLRYRELSAYYDVLVVESSEPEKEFSGSYFSSSQKLVPR